MAKCTLKDTQMRGSHLHSEAEMHTGVEKGNMEINGLWEIKREK